MQGRTSTLALFFRLAMVVFCMNLCPAVQISGTVTDDFHGTGVASALVQIKGTGVTTHTNASGAFTLTTTAILLPGTNPAVEWTLPAMGRVTLYSADGSALAQGRGRDLTALASPLPDGMYLFVVRAADGDVAGKLLKAGAQCQTGPLRSAAKAAADVTLVFTHNHYRTKEQVAAEGDGNVQVLMVQKKGWELDSTMVGLAGVGVDKNSLVPYTGDWEPPAGTRISGKHLTTGLDLSAGNIIIEKCLIQPTSGGAGMPILTTTDFNQFIPVPSKVIIRDCEIDGSLVKSNRPDFDDTRFKASILGFNGVADVRRCWIHGMGSGMALRDAGTQLDCLVEQNVITDMIPWGDAGTTGSHNNAMSIRDFTDARRPDRVGIIRNNRLELYTPYNASSSLQIAGHNGLVANITVEGNHLEGYGYNLWLSTSSYGFKNMKAINNRWVPLSGWLAYADAPGWVVWQENYRYQPAAPPECIGPPVNKP